MLWLILPEIYKEMRNARLSHADISAFAGSSPSAGSRILSIAGDVAEIRISGIMTQTPYIFALIFGGGNVTYSEIMAALAAAESNSDVKRVVMRIYSRGGTVDGLLAAAEAIRDFSKPIEVVVENVAASAAYVLASQADTITAQNKLSQVGSFGVMASYRVDDDVIDITNTDSPKKRPDVTTEEGRAVVREELDAVHAELVDLVASGRGVTAEHIKSNFGQGACFLAQAAVDRGMIDGIAVKEARITETNETVENASMTLDELKAQHPELFKAVYEQGVTAERERVSCHLTMGEASGAMDDAVKAALDGDEYTALHGAKYSAKLLSAAALKNMSDDDAGQASAADNSSSENSGGDDAVLALVEQQLGITGS